MENNKKGIATIVVIILIVGVVGLAAFAAINLKLGEKPRKLTEPLAWVENALTQPLPENASKTRLGLPARLEDLMPNGAPITGFGAHNGQHAEGLDHCWVAVKRGEPSRSWADGTVIQIEKMGGGGEYMIYIDFGDGLSCSFAEIHKPLVKKGQRVSYFDPIGEIGQFQNFDADEIEIYCADSNRFDGIIQSAGGSEGSAVSPFDYLNEADKKALEEAYKAKVLEPFLAGEQDYGQTWYSVDPFLTNKIMVHEESKISGEWFLINKTWNTKDLSLVVFLPCKNQYCHNNEVRLRGEDANLGIGGLYIDGTYSVAYEGARAKIVIKDKHQTLYALAEVTEDTGQDVTGTPRAQMKFEYGRSPINQFSSKALTYQERGIYNPRYDAWKLGNWVHYQ